MAGKVAGIGKRQIATLSIPHNPRGTMRTVSVSLTLLAVLAAGPAIAGSRLQQSLQQLGAKSVAATVPGTWSSWGGEVKFQFNPDRLRDLGLEVRGIDKALSATAGFPGLRYQTLSLRARQAGALNFVVVGGKPESLHDGSLQYDGGFVIAHAGGEIDLHGLRIQPSGKSNFGMEVVDSGGKVWLRLDHTHFDMTQQQTRLRLRDMNMRLAPAFAEALGRPDLTDVDIGGADVETDVAERDVDAVSGTCSEPWPGPGLNTDITVFYGTNTWVGTPDSVVAKRCNIAITGACTAASTNGEVVIDPDSSLRNSGNTAVAWRQMFSGDFPPYNNDQHPFLVWNLYRFGNGGGLKQIGVSGVKHAFLTINDHCSCSDSHVIYPDCEDTYSTFNNDSSGYLGPRRELIPARGIWGRCGSVYDADCNAVQDAAGGAADLHQFRLNAVESDLLPASNPGATYFLEYWYVVRDDVNIYNTMGHRSISATKSGSTWTVAASPTGNFTAGPAINRWVDPAAPGAGQANNELASGEGHARVAVRTTDLGGGLYRYEYAVMNFDFARAQIDPAHASEPNLKVLSNDGFGSFSMDVPGNASITNVTFADTDLNAANDWTATTAPGTVGWVAPAGNRLNWGTMYRFGFTSNIAPLPKKVTLGVANAGTPATYIVDSLAPATDRIFADNFEVPPGG